MPVDSSIPLKTTAIWGISGGAVIADKAAIPGIGWFAQFKDPEGNVFGAMQDDPTAK